MRLEKTRDAIRALAQTAQRHYEGAPQERVVVNLRDDATAEVEQAEALLREAATLKTLAAAGLSAYHGISCKERHGPHAASAEDCADVVCRAWASAVKDVCCGEHGKCSDCPPKGPEAIRNAALEEAADYVWNRETDGRLAEGIRAMKTEDT